MFETYRLRCNGLFFLLAAFRTVVADEVTAGEFSAELTKLLTVSASLSSLPTPNYANDRGVFSLVSPIFAPNYFVNDGQFQSQVAELDNVPEISEKSATFGAISIPATLEQVKNNVVLSQQKISKDDEESIKSANNILYNVDRSPSIQYERYLKYKVDYEDLIIKANAETNAGELQVLRSRLAQVNREWDTLGNRPEIELAIRTIAALGGNSDRSALEAWSAQIKYTDFSSIISDSLSGNSWIRVSYSEGNLPNILSVTTSQESVDVRPIRVSFDGTLVWLDRSYLSNSFFLDRGWRLENFADISTGFDHSGKQSLLPRVVGGVLLAKNIEIQYTIAGDVPLDQKDSAFSIDGVILPSDSISSSIQRNSLTVPGPVIIGVVIDRLRKIPDPDPERNWNN